MSPNESEVQKLRNEIREEILKRKSCEQELLQKEEFFNSFLENANTGLALIDESGHFASYNPAFLKLFGLSENSTIRNINDNNWSEWKVFDENLDLLPVDEHPVRKAAITGKVVKDQVVAVKSPSRNDLTWMMISAKPLFTEDKRIDKIICTYNDITRVRLSEDAQKKAEAELLKSQENFRTSFEEGAIAMTMTSVDGTLIRVNNAFCELTGYSRSELRHMKFQDLTFRDDLPDNLEGLAKILTGEISSFRMEKRYVCKNGDIIWGDISTAAVKDGKGKTEYLITHVQNINERKKAELDLKKSQEKYKELVDNARSIIVRMNTEGVITFFNEYGQELLGFSEDELIGKTVLENIVPEKDLKGNLMQPLLDNIYGDPDKYEININENIKKNGERLVVEWHNRALFDDAGKRTGHLSVGVDITSRVKAEQELKESKEKLEAALELGHIGMWEWDLIKNEVILDERMREMLGCKDINLDLKYKLFEKCINDEDLPHFREALKQTMEGDSSVETVFRTNPVNGDYRFISIKSLVSRSQNGEPLYIRNVCFDITAMKKGAESVLIKLNEELLRSNKDLHQFAYVASHDLQEPLRMVSSFTQMLEHRYKDKLDDDAREYIRFAVEGSKRMYDLINGLLAYSKVQTKGVEFSMVKMDNVLDKVIQNLSFKIEERKAVINKKKLPVLLADENQMIQLLQNLIENSIKFSKSGPEISVSSDFVNDSYIFSVKDNGIGVESQYFERIFQIFQRLHKRNEYDGTGIGLAICRRIVERHGGKIWLDSVPGNGCTFYFSIPKNRPVFYG